VGRDLREQPYRDRLAQAAERYKLIQMDHVSKAWGHLKDAQANIPNTAEVMAILRRNHESYESDSVQWGLNYLATRVFTHPLPMGEGGRWPLTRFFVYGLVGLTQWEQWTDDHRPRRRPSELKKPVTLPDEDPKTVPDAVTHCIECLQSHRLGDGWPDRPDASPPRCSVLETAGATMVLSRLGVLPDEVHEARNFLADVQSAKDGSWPEIVGRGSKRGEGSPAHTSLAVLALADGDDNHKRHAERGRDWLLNHAGRWERATDPEQHEGVEEWLHMTFSLGLRACLRMGIDPLLPALRPSIELLDELWVDDANEWRGGEHERPSVHGSHAVVMAYEELKRAQARVDPETFFRLVRAAENVQQHYRLQFGDSPLIEIVDTRNKDRSAHIELGSKSWSLVRRVADLQYGAHEREGLIPLDELSDLSDDIKTMIRRINRSVAAATDQHLDELLLVPRRAEGCRLTLRPADQPPSTPRSSRHT